MAIENELPHYTGDAAHALEAARREIAALRKQVQECEFDVAVLRAIVTQYDRIGLQLHPAEWQEIAHLATTAPLLPEGVTLPANFTQLAGVRALQTAYEHAQAEIRRIQEQWDQAEAHNNDLREQLAAICAWCQANARAARNRAAQTGDGDWRVRERVVSEVWELVKPVV